MCIKERLYSIGISASTKPPLPELSGIYRGLGRLFFFFLQIEEELYTIDR